MTETMTAEGDEVSFVPLADIHVQPGFNPRRYFSRAFHTELTESVVAQGVVQPITARPRGVDGGFWLVAGERRLRAATAAGLEKIPVLIRVLDEREALAASIAENELRGGISAAEEAHVARRAVDLYGDRDEAARRLGWTDGKLKARLLLLHASDEVLQHLERGEINLGHAELLSTLPPDAQVTVLARVMADAVTAAELRKQLATYAQELASAPFDTAGCVGCPSNSSTQSSLFQFHVGAGRCSGRKCWGAKTEAALQTKIESVRTEFNVVFFDRDKDPASHVALEADGERGVGAEQYENGCKACAHYGALVGTRPGIEGVVTPNRCFDVECNARMIKDNKPPPATVTSNAGAAPADANDDAMFDQAVALVCETRKASVSWVQRRLNIGYNRAARLVERMESEGLVGPAGPGGNREILDAPPGTAQHEQAQKKPVKRKPKAGAHPQAVLTSAWEFFRAKAVEHVSTDQRLQLVLADYALRVLDGRADAKGRAAAIEETAHWNTDALWRRIADSTTFLLAQNSRTKPKRPDIADAHVGLAVQLLKSIDGLELSFPVTEAFLKAHTKSGLEALLTAAGYWDALPGDTPEAKAKARKELLARKVPEIAASVLASGFDFSTFVPPVVAEQFAAL